MDGIMLINVQLPRALACGAAARRAVEDGLRDMVRPHVLDDVRTVASELAINAYHNGHGRIVLQIGMLGRRLRIEVVDERRDLRHRDDRDGTSPVNGIVGLHVLDGIAAEWGSTAGSSQVWAELDLDG